MDIKILGSACAVSDYYMETVEKIAQELNLEFSIQKIQDVNELKKYDVYIGCLYGYCPGCNNNHKDDKMDKYTPALVIDGEVKIHSCFPDEDVFRKILMKNI